jgi:hypothetical protein
MTARERARHESKMRTLETLRLVIEDDGSCRFQPAFYGNRSLKVDRRLGWDRMGKR